MQRFITIATVMLSCQFADASDWPTFGHDNRRSFVSDEEVRPPLYLQWVYDSPGPPAAGWSLPVNGYGARKTKSNVSYDDCHPAIAIGDTIYFCSSAENCLYAIDVASGNVRWRFFTDAAPRLAPTYSNGRLFFGADDGQVYCLNAVDGRIVWKLNAALTNEQMLGYGRFSSVWPIRTSVTVDGDIAYFTAGLFPSEGVYLYSVATDDGKIQWQKEVGRLTGNVAHANLAPQGYTLVGSESLYLTSRVSPARFRKSDGEYVAFATPFPSVPKSHEYRFYNGGDYAQLWNDQRIVFGRACLLGYDPDEEWTNRYRKTEKGQLKFHWFNARQTVLQKGVTYVSTDTHILAIDEAQLSDISTKECREFEELYKKLRVADRQDAMDEYDRIVAEHGENHPLATKLRNGTLRYSQKAWDQWLQLSPPLFDKLRKRCHWMQPLNATESLILAGNTLLAGGEESVHAIDAETGKVLWADATESRVRALAAANGHLLVSTTDGRVRCYSDKRSDTEVVHIRPEDIDQQATTRTVTSQIRDLAERILQLQPSDRGHALIVGGNGDLAMEIARHTGLAIEIAAPSQASLETIRERLANAGVYGRRISVSGLKSQTLPYSPYVFNLVVDLSRENRLVPIAEVLRVTRPLGGTAVFTEKAAELPADLDDSFKAAGSNDLFVVRRGKLPGSRDWTHNYAASGNTYSSEDTQVKGPFGILWYGEPGPRQRIDRHAAAPMPLVVNGVMFTIGYDRVMAYDVYNGIKYWERQIPGATRTSLPMGTSNITADKSGLFIVISDTECWHLDAVNGKTIRKFSPPSRADSQRTFWGWLSRHDNLLFGSRALPDRSKVRADQKHSDEIFALSVDTGDVRWQKPVGRVEHDGIAVSDGMMFYVDQVLTPAEQKIARKTNQHDQSTPSRPPLDRRGKPIEPDLRKLVALDTSTGLERWSVPFDATDVTLDDNAVLDGRSGVSCMVKDGVVVVHGVGSVGHPHREFLAGEFARRAIYVFSSADGNFLWGGRKGYRKRPIIAGNYIYAEPFAWHLKTGKQKTILNPLSGKPQPFDFHRGYIGCSHLLASGATLFGDKNGIGYCNLDSGEGFSSFRSLSLACGLGATPANGVFVAPEGRSGCTCSGSGIHTSVALYPRKHARDWAVGVTGGIAAAKSFPVKHAYINLGAPGFREDSQRRLWLPYPPTRDDGIIGAWLPRYQHNKSMFYHLPEERTATADENPSWLFSSGYRNEKPLTFKLQEPGEPEAKYTVTLYFAEPGNVKLGQRVFAVDLQGKPALSQFDIAAQSTPDDISVIRSFHDVIVKETLTISLKAESGSSEPPVLSAIAIERE